MLLVNQIPGFINRQYLKSNLVNQRDILHVDIDWEKVKGDLEFFTCAGSELLSANQISNFFKQLYIKNNKVNLPYILHVDRVSREINVDLENFS